MSSKENERCAISYVSLTVSGDLLGSGADPKQTSLKTAVMYQERLLTILSIQPPRLYEPIHPSKPVESGNNYFFASFINS